MSAPAIEHYLTQVPHRKPIPSAASRQAYPTRSSSSSSPYVGQLTGAQQQPPLQQQTQPSTYAATMASYAPTGGQPARRTLSNATTSTSSTSSSLPKHNVSLRRSSSGHSSRQATSYVALLRKQKATVWCDRSQAEDPRILQAQRLAKERANREVSGFFAQTAPGVVGRVTPTGGSGSFTTGVARKIRHHGAQKTNTFTSGNLAGAGVPMRLSATEVEDEDQSLNENEWEKDGWGYSASTTDVVGKPPFHARSGSGRSSLGSGRRVEGRLPASSNPNLRMSTASSTPSSRHSRSPSETMPDLAEETPVPSDNKQGDYFRNDRTRTGGSSSSGEREAGFGGLGHMPKREKKEHANADELRRRGSVDDRSMTINGAVRLYVANPDLSD